MIKESSGTATKDTRSVDERHEVYEEQLCCTKSCGAATKELQGSYEEQRSCYEGHGMDERLFAFNR
jgi:hypothetical protein